MRSIRSIFSISHIAWSVGRLQHENTNKTAKEWCETRKNMLQKNLGGVLCQKELKLKALRTLWAKHSMLIGTIFVHDLLDISKFQH